MRKLFSFIFLFAAIQISAQSDTCFAPNSKAYFRCERNVERICADYLIYDLLELEEKLLEIHPDPYAYCGKAAFDSAYKKAFNYYSEDRTLIEHAQNLNRFMSVVEDSHMQIHVFRLMLESAGMDSGFLPLFIQPLQGKFYVEKDFIHGPPVGSEILSVGNMKMSELHSNAKQWSNNEGSATQANNEAAPYYYTPTQFFANPKQCIGDSVKIVFIQNEKLDSVIVQLVDLKHYRKIRNEFFKTSKKNIEARFFLNEGRAVLTIHSFSPAPFQNDYKKIRKFFQVARELEIRNIAIDVRDNPGGSSAMVEYLCSFLLPNGMNTPSNIIWKASEESYQIVSNFRLKHFPRFTEKRFKRNEDMYAYFRLSQTPFEELDTAFFKLPQRQRAEHVYTGKTTVFMNGNTVSAACDFAQLLQKNHRALLTGTPCNATANGTWGNVSAIELQETGMLVAIPTIRYNYNNSFSYSRTPIMPDIHLEQTLEDLKSGKDTFLEYFLKN